MHHITRHNILIESLWECNFFLPEYW